MKKTVTPDDCAQLDSLDDIENLLQRETPIKGYKRFYKLSFLCLIEFSYVKQN